MWRSGNAPRTDFATADSEPPRLDGRRLPDRERGGSFGGAALNLALNLARPDRDQHRTPPDAAASRGHIRMNSVRPDNTDPIPLQASPHRMGTILIRFVRLLIVAVMILALAWR